MRPSDAFSATPSFSEVSPAVPIPMKPPLGSEKFAAPCSEMMSLPRSGAQLRLMVVVFPPDLAINRADRVMNVRRPECDEQPVISKAA